VENIVGCKFVLHKPGPPMYNPLVFSKYFSIAMIMLIIPSSITGEENLYLEGVNNFLFRFLLNNLMVWIGLPTESRSSHTFSFQASLFCGGDCVTHNLAATQMEREEWLVQKPRWRISCENFKKTLLMSRKDRWIEQERWLHMYDVCV
jgi:hypothetical protein